MLQDPLFSPEQRRQMDIWGENRLRTLRAEHEAAEPNGFDEETFLKGLYKEIYIKWAWLRGAVLPSTGAVVSTEEPEAAICTDLL